MKESICLKSSTYFATIIAEKIDLFSKLVSIWEGILLYNEFSDL